MLSCLLCGKKASEVRHMIAGSAVEGAAICDECVGQAVILLIDEGWVPMNPGLRITRNLPYHDPGEPE